MELANLRGSLEKSETDRNNAQSEVERWKKELEHEKEVAQMEVERRKEEAAVVETRHAEK